MLEVARHKTIGRLVTIEPEELMPVSSTHWLQAPAKIIGMILEVRERSYDELEAKVYVVTDVPGLANRNCWIRSERLNYLQETS